MQNQWSQIQWLGARFPFRVCAKWIPRGPEESAQSWYANARIGVYIYYVILWELALAAQERASDLDAARVERAIQHAYLDVHHVELGRLGAC